MFEHCFGLCLDMVINLIHCSYTLTFQATGFPHDNMEAFLSPLLGMSKPGCQGQASPRGQGLLSFYGSSSMLVKQMTMALCSCVRSFQILVSNLLWSEQCIGKCSLSLFFRKVAKHLQNSLVFNFILYVWVFCLYHTCAWYLKRLEEGIRLPGTVVADGCQPLCGCKELMLGLLKDQPASALNC